MSKRLMRWLVAGAAAACLSTLSGCGGGSTLPPAEPERGSITGVARASADSAPIGGASVSADGQTTTTAADGSFRLDQVNAASRVVVKIAAAGFVDGTQPVPVQATRTAHADFRLVRASAAVQVDAAQAATVTAPDSLAAVDLAANSLVNASSGAAATGMLTVRVTPIDPAADPQSMPGNYTTNLDQTIESFGAVNVSLKDAQGNRLNLKAGTSATIRIPLASRSANPPATIPLYYLDEASGLWVQEGTATLRGNPPNRYYEGTVTHFTTWNADQVQDTIFVHGCVRDANAAAVAGARVRSVGIDYSGTASALSVAPDGKFSVAIRRNGRAAVFAEHESQVSNTVIAGPSATDITLVGCLTLNPQPVAPLVLEHPADTTVTQGAPAFFHVVANGSAPLRYQWQRNGVDIPGATFEWLFVPLASAGDNGARYSVVVSNAVGSATSNPGVLSVTAPVPTVIVTPPASTSVQAGETASFSVVAVGGEPLSYQWQRNGVEIAGATSRDCVTPALQLSDSGALYRVVVTGAAGAVTSSAATLTVTPQVPTPPAITAHPASTSVGVGISASFSVGASGTPPLAYQWLRDGSAIAGATSATYTTPPTLQSDNGAVFSVRVTNAHGSVTSNGATLTVSADDTDDKVKLMRLLTLSFDFVQAAAAGFELANDDFVFVDPATVCRSGSISGTINGSTPGAGQPLPPSGTLAVTLNACNIDETTYTGSSSVSYDFSSIDPPNGTLTATLNNMRVRSVSGNSVIQDVTANGVGSESVTSSVANADTATTIALTLANGATLRNELTALTATFASGSVGFRTMTTPDAGPVGVRVKQFRFSYDNLSFSVAGVSYVASGAYQLDFNTDNSIAAGSGEVLLRSNGVTIGRIYATNEGTFIEVNGTVQPFAAKPARRAMR